MTIMLAAKLAIAVGFLFCAAVARVIYVEDQRDRAPVSRRPRR